MLITSRCSDDTLGDELGIPHSMSVSVSCLVPQDAARMLLKCVRGARAPSLEHFEEDNPEEYKALLALAGSRGLAGLPLALEVL